MSASNSLVARRDVVGGLFVGAALLGTGCSKQPIPRESAAAVQPEAMNVSAPLDPRMIVYRDPNCGCCEKWAQLAKAAGFHVEFIDHSDMPAIKARHGVPQELASCHTALVGGYAIEGHVPLAAVQRLLRERPARIAGLAVPGMPRGSPGMEMPDGSKDDFEVLSFDRAGKSAPYRV